jgi:hypothetical protein
MDRSQTWVKAVFLQHTLNLSPPEAVETNNSENSVTLDDQ